MRNPPARATRVDTTVGELRDAVVEILKAAVHEVPTSATATERLFFPKGINFISVQVTFDPAKTNFQAGLIISSDPVKSLEGTAETEEGAS